MASFFNVVKNLLLSPTTKPEGRPSAEENWLWLWLGFFKESEEGMVLHTYLPEGLAEVSTGHQELQGVLVRAVHVRSELDEETLPLEAQLPHLGPVKSIDLREALRKESNPMSQARRCVHVERQVGGAKG